jgi:hypothetical protein
MGRRELKEYAAQQGVCLGQHAVRGQRHQDGVPVRRRLGSQRHADAAARAALVLDDDGLAEILAHRFRNRASDDVGQASWREGNDHRDRLGWESALRDSKAGRGTQAGGDEKAAHHQGNSLGSFC